MIHKKLVFLLLFFAQAAQSQEDSQPQGGQGQVNIQEQLIKKNEEEIRVLENQLEAKRREKLMLQRRLEEERMKLRQR